MKKALEERMKECIFYIPNNEDYNAIKEICATVSEEQIKRLDKSARKDKAVLTNVNNMAVKQTCSNNKLWHVYENKNI